MFTFLDILEAERKLLTVQEYNSVRERYLSGDEHGAIKSLDNILKDKLREYVRQRSGQNG